LRLDNKGQRSTPLREGDRALAMGWAAGRVQPAAEVENCSARARLLALLPRTGQRPAFGKGRKRALALGSARAEGVSVSVS
jgi:hypothetical protein